eukprot:COSAG06_NODE_7059_length_2652_cov_3.164904_3_plen_93_part_00
MLLLLLFVVVVVVLLLVLLVLVVNTSHIVSAFIYMMRPGGDDSPTFRGTPKRLDVAIAVRPLCKNQMDSRNDEKPFRTIQMHKTVSSAFNRK